jgi:acetoin utilization deacetylase AcuC-like enzyme
MVWRSPSPAERTTPTPIAAARRVVILDCDVHQGNGTAAIFRNDRSVFTFAIFADRNFPFAKEPSDLDVPLIDGTTDEGYLEALDGGVRRALERAAADLAVYLAGADPFEGDRLGRLAVTKAGLAARDRLVLDRCRNVGIPVAIAMAGGYAHDIDDTVDIHVETVRAAGRFAER